MPNITFHDKAREAINNRAQDLLNSIRTISEAEVSNKKESFQTEAVSAGKITRADMLGSMDVELVDTAAGTVSLIVIETQDGLNGFSGDAIGSFEGLLDEMYKPHSVKDSVTKIFLRKTVKEWLREYKNTNTHESLSAYTERLMADAIEPITVWVPIAKLYIEEDFILGPASFQSLSKAKMDEWYVRIKKNLSEENEGPFESWFAKRRKSTQGLAAVVVDTVAERARATELALEVADEASAYLRLFHPANLAPRISSYCRPLGMEYMQQFDIYAENQDGIPTREARIMETDPGSWKISGDMLKEFKIIGLNALHNILTSDSGSQFQQELLAALLIYSRNVLAKDPIEKLVFVLVALETLLLKDENEHIQQNIGERLAFVLSSSPDKRRNIVHLTKECYGFRSRFLHHGRDEHEVQRLGEFMQYAWEFFWKTVRHNQQFQTKSDLIRAIEDVKFS